VVSGTMERLSEFLKKILPTYTQRKED